MFTCQQITCAHCKCPSKHETGLGRTRRDLKSEGLWFRSVVPAGWSRWVGRDLGPFFTVQVRGKTDSCNDTTTKCFGPVTEPQLSASRVTLPLHFFFARCARTHGNRHVVTCALRTGRTSYCMRAACGLGRGLHCRRSFLSLTLKTTCTCHMYLTDRSHRTAGCVAAAHVVSKCAQRSAPVRVTQKSLAEQASGELALTQPLHRPSSKPTAWCGHS